MILNIIDTINEWIEPFRSWIMNNHDNPFLWAGLVILGLLVFTFTYNALHKD